MSRRHWGLFRNNWLLQEIYKDYASIAKPLTAVTSKKSPDKDKLVWTAEHLNVPPCVCVCDVLNVPMYDDVFMLQSDVSGVGLCTKCDLRAEGTTSTFFSRQLKDREMRYSATKLECLKPFGNLKFI